MAHGCAAANSRRLRHRIHCNSMHPAQVDHEVAFREGLSCNAMPATAHSDLKTEVASEIHSVHNIIHIGALGDDCGPAIDHGVENRPSFIVGEVVGDDDLSVKALRSLSRAA
jgi:hypothetical protein